MVCRSRNAFIVQESFGSVLQTLAATAVRDKQERLTEDHLDPSDRVGGPPSANAKLRGYCPGCFWADLNYARQNVHPKVQSGIGEEDLLVVKA